MVHQSCLSRVATMARVRKDLSFAQKLEILDKIKLQLPGCNTRRLSEILGVPKSTVFLNKIKYIIKK